MKRNKCYIVINSLRCGGAERVASLFANHLDGQGINTVILCTDSVSSHYSLPGNSSVKALPLSHFARTIAFPLVWVVQSVYLALFLSKDDLCFSFLHRSNIINCLSGALSKRRVIVMERSVFSRSYLSGISRSFMRFVLHRCYKRADRVVAISDVVLDELVNQLGVKESKIAVISNPVDVKLWQTESIHKAHPGQPIRFCIVGRLIPSKRVDLAIKIIKALVLRGVDANLIVAGSGAEERRLRVMVANDNLSDNIRFYGQVHDVGQIFRESDFSLFTSSYESFGNVAIESVACGTPVFYTANLKSVRTIIGGFSALGYEIDENVDVAVEEVCKQLTQHDPRQFASEREGLYKEIRPDLIFNKYLQLGEK